MRASSAGTWTTNRAFTIYGTCETILAVARVVRIASFREADIPVKVVSVRHAQSLLDGRPSRCRVFKKQIAAVASTADKNP